MAALADRPSVILRVAHRVLAIPVEHVVETMRPLPIVDGRAEIRGAPCPVVDVACALALTADAPARRFVIVRGAHGPIALAVDDVIGVGPLGDGAPVTATSEDLAAVLRDARWIAASDLHAAAGAAEPHGVS
ncbi:MAG TPA: chemotaxis protein CheW [Kofleriaceae bacterium]|nr:chemotaxis protein CheW [Kofleriaceae bacterium]